MTKEQIGRAIAENPEILYLDNTKKEIQLLLSRINTRMQVLTGQIESVETDNDGTVYAQGRYDAYQKIREELTNILNKDD